MAIRVGGIEFVINANVSQALRAFSTLGKQGKKLQNNLRQTTTLFGGLGQQLTGLKSAVGGIAAAFGAFKLGNFIKDATLLAARVKNLGTVLDNVGRIAGLNSAQIRNVENSVKRLGITTRAARQSLAQLAQANLDLRKAAQLTRIAQDAAVIAGIDSSEAFNRLVVSIQRNDVRLLRNLGIVINLNSVYQKFAQTAGRTAASLTAFEKRQLLLNEVIDRGRLITGTYEASLNDTFKQLTSLRRVVEEATRVFGEQFEPVLAKVVKTAGNFLKAFTKGQTVIGPRFVAVVGTAIIALGGLAVAIGSVAAATAALSIAGGPITIILTAVAAALGIAAAAWVNYELELAAAENRLKTVGEEAENTAQAIVDAQKSLGRLEDLSGRPFGISAKEGEEVRVIAADLARAFPELADSILVAGEQGEIGAAAIVQAFRSNVPLAMQTSEDAVESLKQTRLAAEQEFRKALFATRLEQAGVSAADQVRLTNAQFHLGELATATDVYQKVLEGTRDAQRQVNKDLEDGVEEFIVLNPLLTQSTDGMKKFSEQIIAADRAAAQFRQARLTKTFQEFQVGLAELEQGANQAIQIISKLDSQRLRVFKNTNVKLLRDFRVNQNQLISVDIKTREQLEDAAAAFVAAQRSDAKRILAQKQKDLALALKTETITRAEFKDKEKKILREFAQTERRIAVQSNQLIEQGVENQKTILEARTKSIENVTLALEKQEAATRDLLELQQLELAGIAPQLIRLRRRFQDEQRRLTGATAEYDQELIRVETSLEKLGARGLVSVLRGLTEIPAAFKKNLTGPIANLASRLIQINRTIIAGRNELLAKEKKFNAEFLNEVKRRNQKLVDAQEKLNKRLLELQDPKAARLSTLAGVEAAVEEIKAGGRDVEEFFRNLGTSLDDRATPGVAKLVGEFDKFRDVLKKTTSETDLLVLAEQFPQALTRGLEASKKELKELQTELKKFQEIEKPKQQRDDRIERQRRFNELVDAGVPAFKARQEVQRIELEQRDALEAKETAIQTKIKEQQQRQRALAEKKAQLEQHFTILLEQQKTVLAEQVALREKLIALRQQEIAITQAQLDKSKEEQKKLQDFAKGGVAQQDTEGRTPGTPGAPAAPSQQRDGKPSSQTLADEAASLQDAVLRRNEAIDEGLMQTQRSLRNIRQDVDDRQGPLDDQVNLIRIDADRGREAFKKLRLARRR